MMMPKLLAKQGWTVWHPVLGLALMALGMFFTRDAWIDIVEIAFKDAEASHIILVPIVAAWMVWARRVRIRLCPPAGQAVGPLIAFAGAAIYFVGYYNAVQSFWHLGAVLVAIGCLLSVLGKHVLFRFLPAFVVLVFLVPVPGRLRHAIAGPLQEWGAAAAQAILETCGVMVERSGNLLTINNMDVAVAEACNGMRMVFGLVLIVYAFAFGMPLRNSVRVVLLLASPIVALLCNIVRLVPTVVLYGEFSKQTADMFHDISGWIMLPIAFVILLGGITLLKWALVPVGRFNLAYQ